MKMLWLAAALAASGAAVAMRPAALDWAYPYLEEAQAPEAQDLGKAGQPPAVYTVPGSSLRLTEAQLSTPFHVVDWKPQEHPAPPPIVVQGRKPDVAACGLCHMVGGQGGSEAPALAALSRDYILEQMAAFREGRRVSADPRRGGPHFMQMEASRITPQEAAAAADYYAGLRYKPWIRVVETGTVPRTTPHEHGWLVVAPGAAFEPIGRRVIQVAQDAKRSALDDPDSGLIAYAPKGALGRGRRLATTGGGVTLACATCHGVDLRGTPIAPPLAGRSAPYLARQLWDIKAGGRTGNAVAPMQPVVARLGPEEIADVTAYLASRRP